MLFNGLLESGYPDVGGLAKTDAYHLLAGLFDIYEACNADHRRFAIVNVQWTTYNRSVQRLIQPFVINKFLSLKIELQ